MNLEQKMTEIEKNESIICPYCGFVHKYEDDPELFYGLVTYYGEEEPQEFECSECEATFIVEEHVQRTFETKKLEDDEDED